jgi:ABC-type phosphate/phosphonate transport system substrate-binding protein
MRVRNLNAILATLALGLMCGFGPAGEPTADVPLVKVGMPSSMFRDAPPAMVTALAAPFYSLVHQQTGLKSELVLVPTPDDMRMQLATGQIQFGVFHGFEFAWMQQKSEGLEPLMIAAPVHRPIQSFLIVHATCLAKSLADLKGQTLAIPKQTKEYTRLYADRSCRKEGKPVAEFFGQVVTPANPEEALHDVADNKTVQAAVVDWAALQCFQARNEGRFKMLKVIAKSEPFPEAVVAIWHGGLDARVVGGFKTGMANARATPLGRQLLSLLSMAGFEPVPANYRQHLAETAKAYPPPETLVAVPVADSVK